MQKYFITGTFLRFLQSSCAVVTKKYWAPETEKISTLTIFNLLSFLLLRNIRGTYSKYFKSNIYETDTSSASQGSTT